MVPFFAAIDWGTSNFRLWLVDHDGRILARKSSDQGMSALSPDRYSDVLEAHLQDMQVPADLPAVVSGMAGSRSGWAEAPYLTAPVPVDRLCGGAVQPDHRQRPVWIMSGICQRDPACPDVMRGEETQIAGARRSGAGDGIYCLPGTHSKWVSVVNGSIERFRTYMTGELFALMSKQSILAGILNSREGVWDEKAFTDAAARMFEHPDRLTSELFSIRAGALLDRDHSNSPMSSLSGLLIGVEVAAAKSNFAEPREVYLVSDDTIGPAYGTALRLAGIEPGIVDAEEATVNGLHDAATRLLEPQPMVRNA